MYLLLVHINFHLHPVDLIGKGLNLFELIVRVLHVVESLILEEIEPFAEIIKLILDILVFFRTDILDFLFDFHELLFVFRGRWDLINEVLDNSANWLVLVKDEIEYGDYKFILRIDANL